MKVRDKKLVRTSSFGDGEDYASLELAFPTRSGFQTYSGTALRRRDRQERRGREARRQRRERRAPRGGAVRGGLHLRSVHPLDARSRSRAASASASAAALRYADADSAGSVHTVIATSSGSGRVDCRRYCSRPSRGSIATSCASKGLSEMPGPLRRRGHRGRQHARSRGGLRLVAHRSLGSAYRGGKEFFFQDLAVGERVRRDAPRGHGSHRRRQGRHRHREAASALRGRQEPRDSRGISRQ